MKLLFIGALIGIFIMPPYFIGKNVEPKIDEIVKNIDEIHGYSAEEVSFENGWFSSKSRIIVRLEQPIQTLEETEVAVKPEFYLDANIQHGLFFLSPFGLGLLQFHITPDASKEFKQLASEHISFTSEQSHIFDITGQVDFGGTVDLTYAQPELNVEVIDEQTQQPMQIELMPFNLDASINVIENEVEYSGDSSTFNMLINLPHARVNGAGEVSFKLGEMRFNGTILPSETLNKLFYGTQIATLDSIAFKTDDKEIIRAGEIGIDFKFMPQDGMHYAISLSDFIVNQIDTEINNAIISFSVLDIETELEKSFEKWSQVVTENPENQQIVQAANAQILSTIQQYPPSLKINDISLTFDSGESFNSNGGFSVDKNALAQGLPLPLIFDANLNAKLSQDFFAELFILSKKIELQPQINQGFVTQEQVTEMLNAMQQNSEQLLQIPVKMGYLVKDESGDYSAKIAIKEGSFLVNGNEHPLPVPNL